MLRRIFRKKVNNEFLKQFYTFKNAAVNSRFEIEEDDIYPCLNDNTPETQFDAHYVYHPAWAARILKKINPKKHIDISSTLHFCSMISAFIETDFYDFRPADLKLSNLNALKGDLLNLDFKDNSIESLSCMHTIEHIGLGRYGDVLDIDGDLKALNELKRVCAKNGNLLIVVPVGKQKISFNAHRIYNPILFLNYMEGFSLKEFSLITDANDFINDADLSMGALQNYGCGCFWFLKN